jgi:mono/diheme cytochrome c family protein
MKSLGFALITAVVLAQSAAAGADRPIDFSRDIRPLLSENCFACHGPDQEQRKAKLRLDTREGAFADRDGHPVITPGDGAKSELIKRLVTTDPDDLMPPAKTGKKLSPAQIELLTRWIDEGAKWDLHWAFQKPVRPPLPSVANESWPRNEIDHFILQKIEAENLEPRPETDKPTLIRRASLDLIGLPPTPEELDAFLADGSAEAYGKVVDRLLNSARYGEHQARYWLDAARYADSHGYHIDSTRGIWKYREWVINAYNQNLPFDQFAIEQIAGDLLPEPTPNQRIATGYIRCNMSTGEGGAIEEEYRAKYAFDRMETTSTMFLGLTMTCARCHTHKYDPITHKEYYQMLAFFNTLDEPVMDGNKPNPDPFIKVPSSRQAGRQNWLNESIARAVKEVEAPIPSLDASQPAWESQWHDRLSGGWSPLDLSAERTTKSAATFKPMKDKSLEVEIKPSAEVIWQFSADLAAGELGGLKLELLPGKEGTMVEEVRLAEFEAEIIKDGSKPQKLAFTASSASAEKSPVKNALDGKLETVWEVEAKDALATTAVFLPKEPVKIEGGSRLVARFRFKDGSAENGIRRLRLSAATDSALLASLFPVRIEPWRMVGPFKGEDIAAALEKPYPPEEKLEFNRAYPGVRDEIRWAIQPAYEDDRSHSFVQYLHGVHGVFYFHRKITAARPTRLEISLRADDLVRVWFNGAEIARRDRKWALGEAPLALALDLAAGENEILIKVVNHQGESRFRFDKMLVGRETLPGEIAALLAASEHPAGEKSQQVRNHYRAINSPEWKATSQNLALWRDELEALDRSIPTTLVAKEAAKPRQTAILMRGEYDKPGEKVSPGVPAILPPLSSAGATNRLGFAKWLVSPEHPLTARVIVNRMWQQFFGIGLVKTTEDFGMQSDNPSHPELLDWLATEFIRSGWNVKYLQKLLVTSAAYRQSSMAPPELFARDPENRLLARGPRFRLDAETLRDTALALGGILVEEIGGRSIKPFQPAGLWEAISFNNSQKYDPDEGQEQYRRSLYIYWKRQSPPPNMLLFDAPTREYCVVRRPRTNTPLQALAMLNDPQFVESSRAFAVRILRNGGSDDCSRLCHAFLLATSRKPASEEEAVLKELLQAQRKEFASNPAAARDLLKIGTWQPAIDASAAELAAWTTVASTIMNLDETITKN